MTLIFSKRLSYPNLSKLKCWERRLHRVLRHLFIDYRKCHNVKNILLLRQNKSSLPTLIMDIKNTYSGEAKWLYAKGFLWYPPMRHDEINQILIFLSL